MKYLLIFSYEKVDWLDPLVSNDDDELFSNLNAYKLLHKFK